MNFLNQLKANEDKPHPVKFTNIDFSLQDINKKLKSVNQYEYKDLVNIIYNSYETILDDIFISDKKLHPKQYNSIYIYLSEKELLLETGIYKTLPKVEILNE